MKPPPDEVRSYHHGDLRQALVDAARALLEADGPRAISMRAVARGAGVSPAAPYHHFKDKDALLSAVGLEGWLMLDAALTRAKAQATTAQAAVSTLGLAYVCFALDHPALYRVMYDRARDQEALPDQLYKLDEGAFSRVQGAVADLAGHEQARIDLELATVAAWCAAHGLAEMAGFKQFDHLKAALGGEQPFLRAVLDHLALFPRPPQD
jgi:AcrR family transcriptional regulator